MFFKYYYILNTEKNISIFIMEKSYGEKKLVKKIKTKSGPSTAFAQLKILSTYILTVYVSTHSEPEY